MRKKWFFGNIKAAAKKYKTKKEWSVKDLASYAAAKRRNLLNNKKITGHFAKRTWPRYWTFERIKSAAKKYKTKKEWSIKDKLSYDAARERKLNKNKEITGHFTKTIWYSPIKAKWTFKKIKSAAKKYKTKKEWLTKDRHSHYAAKVKNLLNNHEVTGHFEKFDRTKIWTKKLVLSTAKKFKTIKEWQAKYDGAYQKAAKLKILDQATSHMNRLGDKYNRCIYTIKIKNKKIIYVGLTSDYESRIKEHLKSKRFINLKRKFGKNCIISRKITDYMPIDKAANTEKKQINFFKKKGFNILNKNPGGSLGSITGIWTKEAIFKSAKKYKFLKDWRKHESTAYSTAKRKGYLKEIRKFLIVDWKKIRYPINELIS